MAAGLVSGIMGEGTLDRLFSKAYSKAKKGERKKKSPIEIKRAKSREEKAKANKKKKAIRDRKLGIN